MPSFLQKFDFAFDEELIVQHVKFKIMRKKGGLCDLAVRSALIIQLLIT